MADYSWVLVEIHSSDPEIIDGATREFGHAESVSIHEDDRTTIEGEKAYGLCDELEVFLQEQGVSYSVYADGKYEYDGEQHHWMPGMDAPRIFPSLNNGGRCLTQSELPKDATDEELGVFVREFFAFDLSHSERLYKERTR